MSKRRRNKGRPRAQERRHATRRPARDGAGNTASLFSSLPPLPGEKAALQADPLREKFWENVPLDEMTSAEWEALCDGCGKCCVLKLEDGDTGKIHYTNVTCRLFDCATRSCGQYTLRRMLVPGCVVLSPENIAENAGWMPASCAYRRLHEGRGLADWHPLVSGDPDSVVRAGQALTGRTFPEYEVREEDLEDHVVDYDPLADSEKTG